MARWQGDIRLATRAMEAAAWQEGIKAVCPNCGHWAVFDPHGLWWLCQQRHWDDTFGGLCKRLYCGPCWSVMRKKVRPETLALTKEPASIVHPMPPERVWRQAVKRMKG